jgi:hypothetical protein
MPDEFVPRRPNLGPERGPDCEECRGPTVPWGGGWRACMDCGDLIAPTPAPERKPRPVDSVVAMNRSIDGKLVWRLRQIAKRTVHHGDISILKYLAYAIENDLIRQGESMQEGT